MMMARPSRESDAKIHASAADHARPKIDWSCSSKALTSPSASESAATAPASSSGSKLLGAEEMEATRLDMHRVAAWMHGLGWGGTG